MNKSIQLYTQNGSWICAFLSDNSPDQEIIKLFGTHHLPTAFRATMPSHLVLAEIQKLNPDSVVTIS